MTPARPNPLTPGYRLDRYELLCPVAEGGMASVWVARLSRKHGFEKLVAVKTILPRHASDERFQKMFLDEARIASQIAHGNVGQILDLGEENDVLYIVMEWIDGDSLSRINRAIQKKGLTFPPAIALRVLADTCDGLHYAHELRDAAGVPLAVVHRDVSPQNILVTATGATKLIDFGIAKAKGRLSGDTTTGSLKGKLRYIAPEQAKRESIDRRADIWSVGAVLYHLLSGHVPYDADNDLAMLHALTEAAPPAPLPSIVPAAIGDVVFRALARDPDARFATAMEMRQAIERAMLLTNLSATTNDVAAFLAEHLGEHAAHRRRVIEAALTRANNATARESYVGPPSAPSLESAAPTTVSHRTVILEPATTTTTPAERAEPAVSAIPISGPSPDPSPSAGSSSSPAEPPPVSPPASHASELSANGSFGLASLPAPPPSAPRPYRGLAIAAASLGLAGIGIVLIVLAHGNGGRRQPQAASAPPPPEALASTSVATVAPAVPPAPAPPPPESAGAMASAAEPADSPPSATPTAAAPAPRHRTARPASRSAAPSATPAKPAPTVSAKRPRVDDGF